MRLFFTSDERQTRKLGENWASHLSKGDTLAFTGTLGSGKTTLIQGIIKGLGVNDRVQSPSFVLVRTYKGRFTVKHVDLYRLKPVEIEGLYLEEIFDDEGIMLVEWAEKANSLPGILSRISIDFVPGNEEKRQIQVEGSLVERLS